MDTSKKRKIDDSAENSGRKNLQHGFLCDVNAHIVVAGIGKARCDLFKRQLRNNGSDVHDTYHPADTTHLIVDEKMEISRLCNIMKWNDPPSSTDCKIVKSLWLSQCLREKQIVDTSSYELDVESYVSLKQVKTKSIETETGKGECEKPNNLLQIKSGRPTEGANIVDNQPSTSTDKSYPVASVPKVDDSVTIVTRLDDSQPESELDHRKLPKAGIMYHAYKKKATRRESASDADSDYMPSGGEEDVISEDEALQQTVTPGGKPLPKGNWVCARSSLAPSKNHNKHITDKLEALAKTYENTNDRWRALGYAKAITMLRAYPKEITTFEEARSLRGVGDKLAEKIWEIIDSGELRKLNELSSYEDIKAINLFTGIWGVGATTARSWVSQGLRSLEDVKQRANLTRHQKIGLNYYDELIDRMAREEAGEIEAVVIEATHSIDGTLECMACGSYRRHKSTCGDVDMLISHPDGRSHKGVFGKLLNKLRDTGFLTDDLVSQEESGNQKKYMGVCKLPEEGRYHRRLDIIVVPYDEFACAVMYFTGSAHFNRSMRNLASKMGMSLNEHGLYAGVVRKNGEKITKGYPLKTPDEASVFKHLGLAYLPPEERDH